jgi:hypothetical protein
MVEKWGFYFRGRAIFGRTYESQGIENISAKCSSWVERGGQEFQKRGWAIADFLE